MPAPSPAPWPVSQDVAALADRAAGLSRAGAGPRDDLGTLAAALLRIQPVAHELERRGWLDPEGPGLRAWLLDLRDAVADAEDLLDELHRRREAGGAPLSACVDATFRGPGRKLRRLAERLDRVGDDSERLRPAARAAAGAGGGVRSPSRVTGSVLAERRVFGRERERDSVVASLVGGGREETCGSVAPVVAVVGHGGMGKTALAQCVYNDARVEAWFDVRAWVCVWDRSDEAELTREILQSIGCADDTLCGDGRGDLDSLQEKLEKSAASKRFLLVLDDVWIDEGKTEVENRSVWNKVLAPLRSTAVGSKILVTTRMKLVAEVLDVGHAVSLDGLRSDDCWLLLKEVALGGEAMDFPPELQEIVRAIVSKVKGSPLAAKSIGQMIWSARSTQELRALMNTEISDRIILSSLQLSYQHLPGHLQRCFAYCSIFPTTWRFDRYKLVEMWIALGFIQPPAEEEKRLEDLGQKYFDDLLARSFFGTANKDQQTYYFLDDQMHILAQHFSAHDCMKINEDIPAVIPPTVRHLSVSSDYLPQLKSKYRLGRLRTLLVLRSPSLSSSHFPRTLLAKFKNLRVLDLSESDVAELPETIGQLVHLHYLALCSMTNKLPKSIYRLKHVEVCVPILLFHDNHPGGVGKFGTVKHLKTCCGIRRVKSFSDVLNSMLLIRQCDGARSSLQG
ncbi:hypothetical protein U9M48_043979 [Paspalum notatum var. saurae]|uniref:NB-ARC domain-containing protein n=1 Tax=Paspalum notatum var. saurae TaxID=547442 RepID=A0AAQ3UU28_PASNO